MTNSFLYILTKRRQRLRCSTTCFIVALISVSMAAPPTHGSQERAAQSWITFISKESGFKVQLPVQPEHEILTLKSKRGSITHNVYSAEEGGFIFTIDCADLPSQFAGRNDAQDILSAMQEELLKEVKATKTSESVFQLHNYSGREVRFDLLGGQGRMRLILVGPRLYQLLVTRLDVITKSEEPMAQFLQSFTLLDTPATIKTVLPVERDLESSDRADKG